MSVDHEPAWEFEKLAADKIATGTLAVNAVGERYLRLAGAIPLTAGCVGCHPDFFNCATNPPNDAALVISIPIQAETAPAK